MCVAAIETAALLHAPLLAITMVWVGGFSFGFVSG